MDKMLQIDHVIILITQTKRINVIEALKHKYFASIEHEAWSFFHFTFQSLKTNLLNK